MKQLVLTGRQIIFFLLMPFLLIACKDESLIGSLEVIENFTYIDAEQVARSVTQGNYTVYLKPEKASVSQYRLTLVEKNKSDADTQIIRIPIQAPESIKWVAADGQTINLTSTDTVEQLVAISGSAYVPAHALKQPFNLELSAASRDYKEKLTTKKDCKVSVASLESDVGFGYHYYFDGFFLRPYAVSGPMHSMSLEFRAKPSYKKVSYTEAGKEYEYGVILKEMETQKVIARGNAILRVPKARSKVREFTCRPIQ
ncbi:MAG: hypothetical protein H6995_10355 [Pseudomonadales bacterium]|nr:hypothetical protein [Pseudomonadales bacterium]MCP5215397.1 hypothetical protein [Pseudomonadales bacterium]